MEHVVKKIGLFFQKKVSACICVRPRLLPIIYRENKKKIRNCDEKSESRKTFDGNGQFSAISSRAMIAAFFQESVNPWIFFSGKCFSSVFCAAGVRWLMTRESRRWEGDLCTCVCVFVSVRVLMTSGLENFSLACPIVISLFRRSAAALRAWWFSEIRQKLATNQKFCAIAAAAAAESFYHCYYRFRESRAAWARWRNRKRWGFARDFKWHRCIARIRVTRNNERVTLYPQLQYIGACVYPCGRFATCT